MNADNPIERPEDIVRVLRILEYVGPRSAVERCISQSIQGERKIVQPHGNDILTIRAATIGLYPEILTAAAVISKVKGEDNA